MGALETDWGHVAKKTLQAAIPLGFVFGVYTAITAGRNDDLHERKLHVQFQAELAKDPASRTITITVDGVTRTGRLIPGMAIVTDNNGRPNEFSLYSLTDANSRCWFSELIVTDGADKLPAWEKVFGGDTTEKYYANPKLSGERCLALPMLPAGNAVAPVLSLPKP